MRTAVLLTAFAVSCLVSHVSSQSEDDGSYHFVDPIGGRAAWVVDDSSLPWVGSYDYTSSDVSESTTVLMTVVDSSTGTALGECSVVNTDVDDWETFSWTLTADSLQCNVSETNSSRVRFPFVSHSRTFSVRIQSAKGPRCLRDLTVQNEKPVGCPPFLRRNAFTAHALSCGCPHADSSDSRAETEGPEFPIFFLRGSQAPPTDETPAWKVSPCANVNCMNNGTCVVGTDGAASCLCQTGFSGSRCQVDVCAGVPCVHGGVCRADGATAVCECPPHTKGILCEQVVCDPVCAQGECSFVDGAPMCECKQGFIGPNCNVIDVCIGDAACAIFGEHAKCTLEDSSFTTISARLVNATYDCHCPHPQTGQWMDCMSLALSSSTISSGFVNPVGTSSMVQRPTMTPTQPPMLPFQPFSQQTSPQQTGVEFMAFQTTQPSPLVPIHFATTGNPISVPILPAVPQSTPQVPLISVQTEPTTMQTVSPVALFPTPATNQSFGIQSSTKEPSSETSTEEEEEESLESTVSSVILPSSPSPPVHQPVHVAIHSTPFPTPAPMDISEAQTTTQLTFGRLGGVEQSSTVIMEESSEKEATDFGMGHGHQESTAIPFVPMINITEAAPEQTTTEQVSENQQPMWPMSTQQVPDIWKPHIPIEATTPESAEEFSELPMHPFWGVTTESASLPHSTEIQTVERVENTEAPIIAMKTTPVHEEHEEHEEDNEEDHGEEDVGKPAQPVQPEQPVTQPPLNPWPTTTEEVKETTKYSVVGGAVGQSGSNAASWIVAIIAIAVLGLLLLASTLFVLRYIKQSRKLHGKYNPAREEHALSAAYSLPMTHVTKEERLI